MSPAWLVPTETRPTASNRLCITVVEDNESLCAVTVELLQQQGHRVVGVTRAEALGNHEGHGRMDVLLVDVNLPGEDGFSLMHRYRAAYPGLTVVVISSRYRVEDRLACYQAGADAFIAKPMQPEELLAIIQALAHRGKALPADTDPEHGAAVAGATLDIRRLALRGPAGEVATGVAAATIRSALRGPRAAT